MKSALHPWPRGTPFAPLFHSKIISQTSFVNYYYVVSSDSPTRRFVEAVFLKTVGEPADTIPRYTKHYESNYPVDYRREDHNFDWLGSNI